MFKGFVPTIISLMTVRQHDTGGRRLRMVRGALDQEISVSILIFDGDPLIGRALELLLRTSGYDAKYVAHVDAERAVRLDGLRIVLLAPGWSAGSREVVERIASSARREEALPILEMGRTPDDLPRRPERSVPWPCRIAELNRRIDAALLTVPEMNDGT